MPVRPIATPVRTRRTIVSGIAATAGDAGWKRNVVTQHAETMNVPSSTASIAYSGQCRAIAMALGCPPDPGGPTGSGGQHAQIEAQRLAHRPGLEGAAAGCVRGVAVRDLREVTETSAVEVGDQRGEETRPRFGLGCRRAAAHAH